MKPTILIAGGGTGGHVFPGLAVADALTSLADVRVVFGGSPRGIEKDVIPKRGYELELLDIAPIKGGGATRAAKGAFTAARATLRALSVVRAMRPSAVLSVGGYAAGPFALAAVLLGVPLAIMEPNGAIGLTNRVLAPVSKRAYIAWPELQSRVRAGTARVVGVTLRKGLEPSPYDRKRDLQVLVMGGSLGAEALNERVPQALARVIEKVPNVHIVHQTGRDRDVEVRALYTRLGLKTAVVSPFLDDVPTKLASADLVIARSGAGTVAEIASVGLPSILVPFPSPPTITKRRTRVRSSDLARAYASRKKKRRSNASPTRRSRSCRTLRADREWPKPRATRASRTPHTTSQEICSSSAASR